MLPEEFPPELMDALGGEMEEPDEIEVNAPGGGEEGAESDADLIREAIELLQEAAQNESDDADSAVLTKIVADLYKLTAGQQDAEMSAMGGKPKEMRTLSKLYGNARGYSGLSDTGAAVGGGGGSAGPGGGGPGA